MVEASCEGSPAKRELSVRYCMAVLSFMTLEPVAPATTSFLRFAACACSHLVLHQLTPRISWHLFLATTPKPVQGGLICLADTKSHPAET